MRGVAEKQLPFALKVPNTETRVAMADTRIADSAIVTGSGGAAAQHQEFRWVNTTISHA